MSALELVFASGESSLSVRHFAVNEALSSLFEAKVIARSPHDDIDLDTIVGEPAIFRITSGVAHLVSRTRAWSGVVSAMAQVRVEPAGLSTYEITIVPALWLLTQRRNNRLFQHINIPDIIDRLLDEWGIARTWRIARAQYPKLELRVQYAESDYAFFCRLLEEAGVTFYFSDDPEKGSELVMTDAPTSADPRSAPPIPFRDAPEQMAAGELEYVTALHVEHVVRPGRRALRDHDFRRPKFALFGEAKIDDARQVQPIAEAPDAERRVPKARELEQYHYAPSAFLMEQDRGALAAAERAAAAFAEIATPVADDKGTARFDDPFGRGLTARGLEADRASRRRVSFETNVIALSPGTIFSITDHPRRALSSDQRLLMSRLTIEGSPTDTWSIRGDAAFTDVPWRPALVTPKPRINGTQSAMVVGPRGEEIYTDEFGRVRVQFHWDREGKRDDGSSIWMRVSQGWAGAGYGIFTVPRVGHEVLVDFLDGDPDSPIIVGRVFNAVEQVPHKLPENKTVSTWKSASSPGGGGFNEIRFDDAKGREHVFVQAEKDMDTLVKNDEMYAVGHDAKRVVQHDEAVSVGRNRSKVVHMNEQETTGLNRLSTVGANRATVTGVDDTTLVGSKYSVTVARGLSRKLVQELSTILTGPLAPVLSGPIASVLGMIPQTPLGGIASAFDLIARGPLSTFAGVAPEALRNVLGVIDGFRADPGPPPTSFEMVDRKITLSTGESSIVLDGPNVTIFAEGNIMLHARKNAAVLSDGEGAIAAQGKVLVLSKGDDVIVQAAPNVHLNPSTATQDKDNEEVAEEAPVLEELPGVYRCRSCGTSLPSKESVCPYDVAQIKVVWTEHPQEFDLA